MQEISSVNNEKIKEIMKLQQKKYRELSGQVLIEGYKIFLEAVKANAEILEILLTKKELEKHNLSAYKDKINLISDNVSKKLSFNQTSQNFFAVIKPREPKVESGSFVVSTSDSRGYSNSATINKTLVNYIKLAITELNIARESSTSNTIKATLKGNYFNSSFGSVPNILALKWRYRIAGGTWSGYTTITAILSGNTFSYSGTLGTVFDYKKVYEFQFVAQDKLVTVINKNGNSVYVQKGDPLIDLYKDNVKVNGNVMLRGFLGQIAGSITGTTTDNFNTALREGEWQINGDGNITGGPHTGNLFGKLIVKVSNGTTHNNSSNWIWQYFLETSGLVYFRNKTNSGAWSSWSIVRRGNITGWKSLYYNATGTTGSITLNETAANFSCIEIYYYKANCGYSSVKIYSPNGKDVNLMLNQLSEKTIFQNLSKRIKISGTSITVDTNTSGYGNVSISKIEVNTENNIYIFSVIGYY